MLGVGAGICESRYGRGSLESAAEVRIAPAFVIATKEKVAAVKVPRTAIANCQVDRLLGTVVMNAIEIDFDGQKEVTLSRIFSLSSL